MNNRTREWITAGVFILLLIALLWWVDQHRKPKLPCYVQTQEEFEKKTGEIIAKSVDEALKKKQCCKIGMTEGEITAKCKLQKGVMKDGICTFTKVEDATDAAALKKACEDGGGTWNKNKCTPPDPLKLKEKACKEVGGTWKKNKCIAQAPSATSDATGPDLAPQMSNSGVDYCKQPDSHLVIIHTNDKVPFDTRISSRVPNELEPLGMQTRLGFACVNAKRQDYFDVKVVGAGWYAKDGYQDAKIYLRIEGAKEGDEIPYREVEIDPSQDVTDYGFKVDGYKKAIRLPLQRILDAPVQKTEESLLNQ